MNTIWTYLGTPGEPKAIKAWLLDLCTCYWQARTGKWNHFQLPHKQVFKPSFIVTGGIRISLWSHLQKIWSHTACCFINITVSIFIASHIPLSSVAVCMYAQFCFWWFINLVLKFLWVSSSPVQSTSVQWLVTHLQSTALSVLVLIRTCSGYTILQHLCQWIHN